MKEIIELLSLKPYYKCSKVIDIAKGQYKIPETYREVYQQFKRSLQWQ